MIIQNKPFSIVAALTIPSVIEGYKEKETVAKEILDQNKGSIDIRSELGKGTEVIIRIPAKK